MPKEKEVVVQGVVSENCNGMLLPGGFVKRQIWPELIGKHITLIIKWKEEKNV